MAAVRSPRACREPRWIGAVGRVRSRLENGRHRLPLPHMRNGELSGAFLPPFPSPLSLRIPLSLLCFPASLLHSLSPSWSLCSLPRFSLFSPLVYLFPSPFSPPSSPISLGRARTVSIAHARFAPPHKHQPIYIPPLTHACPLVFFTPHLSPTSIYHTNPPSICHSKPYLPTHPPYFYFKLKAGPHIPL